MGLTAAQAKGRIKKFLNQNTALVVNRCLVTVAAQDCVLLRIFAMEFDEIVYYN